MLDFNFCQVFQFIIVLFTLSSMVKIIFTSDTEHFFQPEFFFFFFKFYFIFKLYITVLDLPNIKIMEWGGRRVQDGEHMYTSLNSKIYYIRLTQEYQSYYLRIHLLKNYLCIYLYTYLSILVFYSYATNGLKQHLFIIAQLHSMRQKSGQSLAGTCAQDLIG